MVLGSQLYVDGQNYGFIKSGSSVLVDNGKVSVNNMNRHGFEIIDKFAQNLALAKVELEHQILAELLKPETESDVTPQLNQMLKSTVYTLASVINSDDGDEIRLVSTTMGSREARVQFAALHPQNFPNTIMQAIMQQDENYQVIAMSGYEFFNRTQDEQEVYLGLPDEHHMVLPVATITSLRSDSY